MNAKLVYNNHEYRSTLEFKEDLCWCMGPALDFIATVLRDAQIPCILYYHEQPNACCRFDACLRSNVELDLIYFTRQKHDHVIAMLETCLGACYDIERGQYNMKFTWKGDHNAR